MIGYVLGLIAVAWMPSLDWIYLLLVLPTLLAAQVLSQLRFQLIGFSIAVILAIAWGTIQLSHRLPSSAMKVDLTLSGRISSVVNHQSTDRQRVVITIDDTDSRYPLLRNIKLSHYDAEPRFSQGDWIVITARLQSPLGYLNRASPDSIRKALQNRIDAVGYIRAVHQHQPQRGLRQRVYDQLTQHFNSNQLGFLAAILMGETGDLSQDNWQLLKQTGTVHLAIVSGLHLGVLTLAGLWLGRAIVLLITSLLPAHWSTKLPAAYAVRIPLIIALLLATFYLWFGGAGIALQRAWVLAAVLLMGRLGARSINVHLRLKMALVLVSALDPLAVLDLGFWLSFGLVWVLLQLSRLRRAEGAMFYAVRVQLALSLVMLPILLFATGQLNLLSFVTNLVAIPWVSVGIMLAPALVPLALINDEFGWLLGGWVDLYWQILELFAAVGLSPTWVVPSYYLMIPALLGAVLMILPLRLGGLGVLLLLAVLSSRSKPLNEGFRVHILDVGQGQSAIIDTPKERWIYDTGASYPSGFSTAEQTLIPTLKPAPDIALAGLIISHSDSDHAGGVKPLLASNPVTFILAGQPDGPHQQACQQGYTADSGGVRLLVTAVDNPLDDNDSSCVLLLSYANCTLLIAGDLSNRAELRLMRQLAKQEVSWLHLSHHGSNTSSSAAWLDFWQPKAAIISRGRNNPFGHPHKEVLSRLNERNIEILDTALEGEIRLTADKNGCTHQTFINSHRRYWH